MSFEDKKVEIEDKTDEDATGAKHVLSPQMQLAGNMMKLSLKNNNKLLSKFNQLLSASKSTLWYEYNNLSSWKQLRVKGQGVVEVEFVKNSKPFEIHIFNHDKQEKLQNEHGIGVTVNEKKVQIFKIEQGKKTILKEDDNKKSILHDGGYSYWFSIDDNNNMIKYGVGEVRNNLCQLSYCDEQISSNNFLHDLQYVHLTIINENHNNSISNEEIQWRLHRDPVVVNPPLFVVDNNKFTMEDACNYTKIVPANLSNACFQLYSTVSGNNFMINTPSFPDFTKAIELSIKNPNGWCYQTLQNKASEFGKPNPDETYLRITLGGNLGNSPGIPYVMEIWPPGHYSPIHNHGGADAIIRVLYGEISVRLFPHLSPNYQEEFAEQTFTENDITYLTPGLNQIHQLINKNKNGPTCITIQCYAYGVTDKIHYEYFDFINKDNNTIQQFTPNSDMDFTTFKQTMYKEWIDYLYQQTQKL